jgi:hypothetical protein
MHPAGNLVLAVILSLTPPTASGEGGKIELPASSDQGLPIPAAAKKNPSLGGATTLAPGKNYTLIVYDVEADIESVTAFYESHLPAAQRVSEGQEVRFTTQGGTVRLARVDKGTRITLVVGPR